MSQSAQASPNLVVDGGFSDATGQLSFNTTSAGWSIAGGNASHTGGDGKSSYDFIFNGTANSVGADGNVGLFGPLPPSVSGGGNFLGIDPVYTPNGNNQPSGINSVFQTISGLTVNATYTLSFYWAAAQQTGFNGTTWEGWDFGLGNTSLNVNNGVPNVNGGLTSGTFGGWNYYTTTVTATSASEVLKFIAEGAPTSTQPPFDLLDGVTLTCNTVPDSSSTAGLLGLGVLAMGVAAGCRRFARA
jgi:hypothetical protein